MKLLQNPNKLLISFLVIMFVINLIQGYYTELLADEAYYWMYSNFLDWGYFDHPPMVAVWISISKLFFSSGELSVRFFSAITLSITFYVVWLLIQHPKKKEHAWLFILITLTTSLFNVYGFITVPDTPLLFFMAFFLLGYQKYLKEKSFVSYLMLTLAITGMIYSKYQAVLIVFFVIVSNLKVLKDYKVWIMTLGIILLYAPHLYWQFNNDFPSFKYHLFERKENTKYYFRDTYMHFVNMIAIIGFTFPIVYKSLFKNFKNKDLFQKALNFISVGFVVFFFISTFKGHAQAQWIVAISIPCIIIPFNYIIENPKSKKTFIILASITIIITTFIRFSMAGDSLFGHRFDMHGNKKWATTLNEKRNEKEIVFLNSYQNTSLFWFYSGKKPYQYNSWYKRKNHYDLLAYNKKVALNNAIQIHDKKQHAIDSLVKKNNRKLFLSELTNYKKEGLLIKSGIDNPLIEKNKLNTIKVKIENPNGFDLNKITLKVVLKNSEKENLTYKDKINPANTNPKIQTHPQVFNANLVGNNLEFFVNDFNKNFIPAYIQIIGNGNKKTHAVRMGIFKCNFNNGD